MTNPTIYSYWENGKLICKGSVEEISQKVGLTKNKLYYIKYHPNEHRMLKLEQKLVPLYELYTDGGKVMFKGNAKECAEYLCISERSLKSEVYATKMGGLNGANGALLVRKAGWVDEKGNRIETKNL